MVFLQRINLLAIAVVAVKDAANVNVVAFYSNIAATTTAVVQLLLLVGWFWGALFPSKDGRSDISRFLMPSPYHLLLLFRCFCCCYCYCYCNFAIVAVIAAGAVFVVATVIAVLLPLLLLSLLLCCLCCKCYS